ncbi:hypothetical protein EYF80_019141 [Liparis tanakae]|uniref:Uncharacterized protein n=1 Tax=Liparis tanakae TaxID=230148 RepID=A0A4Z2I096_9TELE|nr:hypothetical protein EYF80_019141 [Liparis tanakae]
MVPYSIHRDRLELSITRALLKQFSTAWECFHIGAILLFYSGLRAHTPVSSEQADAVRRAMLEKWGTLLRSSVSLMKQISVLSSSFPIVLTHSSLLGGELLGAELSCCRASFRANSLHSKHCW